MQLVFVVGVGVLSELTYLQRHHDPIGPLRDWNIRRIGRRGGFRICWVSGWVFIGLVVVYGFQGSVGRFRLWRIIGRWFGGELARHARRA